MKKKMLVLLTIFLFACNQAQEKISPTDILIKNVNIIDVRSGSILANQYVVIDSGKIKSISEKFENTAVHNHVINAENKYLMPGLAEMHAHIPPPSVGSHRIEETLFLYLSNGITTIRGMLGDSSHLILREKAKNGEIISPRIFTSSPSMNGNTVKTPEEAIIKVKTYHREGYDFLKIHPGIRLKVFDAIVKTAQEVGIPFAGHVPVEVGIRHALESSYASIDHVDGFLEGLVPDSLNLNPSENGFFGYAFTKLADTTKIDELVQLSKQNKVWIVPTQSLFERWFAPISAAKLLKGPEMKYMPKATLENWEQVKQRYMNNENFNINQWRRFDSVRRNLIKKLQDNGHGMLLGSDAPQLFNVPGFSIHHEIDGMQRAGLTPLQIIKTGTINPAIFFDMEDEFGEVKEGLDADLILIDSNPLENLDGLQNISGVIIQGKWMPKSEIDRKLEEIAKNAAK